jgi:hypothetical protein
VSRLQLVVEGPDDQHVIGHLLMRRGIRVEEPKVAGGIPPLLENLHVYLRGSADAHAIVVDADLDVAARWQAVRQRIEESGYRDVPRSPNPSGTIIEQAGKRPVGVWIMPDNTIPGTLEHFVHMLVPEGDSLWPVAKLAIANIPEGQRHFPDQSAPKAEIHTWLAWQQEPGTPMGSAINQRYLTANSPYADAFVSWIERLLALTPTQSSSP